MITQCFFVFSPLWLDEMQRYITAFTSASEALTPSILFPILCPTIYSSSVLVAPSLHIFFSPRYLLLLYQNVVIAGQILKFP